MIHEHDTGQTIIRALLYLGVFALVGAGFFARYISPALANKQAWRLWYMLSMGFIVALGSTLYGVYHTTWMLGDTALMWAFLTDSTQGKLLLARIALLVGLLVLSLGWFRLDKWVYPPLGLALLLTLSLTSHAGAKGGWVLAADYVHAVLASLWVGGVAALGLVWLGSPLQALRQALGRVSRLSLLAALGVALAGLVLSLVQLQNLSNLFSSRYGATLVLKLGLIALIALLAAINRFWLMPRFSGKMPTVSLEALLMAGVLGVTGVLASTEPPPKAVAGAAPTVVNIRETLGEQQWIGQAIGQVGEIHLYLDLRDKNSNLYKTGPKINLRARQGTLQTQQQTLGPYNDSQYHGTLELPKAGIWTFLLQLPGQTFSYTLKVPPP